MKTRVNTSGQTLGKKGEDTKRRLIHAAAVIVARSERPTTATVAAEAAVSVATFYLYFKNLSELYLALCEVARADMVDILDILAGDWRDDIELHSHELTLAFYAHWNRHRIILSIRNHESDLGNKPFSDARRRAAMPVIDSLSTRIRDTHGHDQLPSRTALARAIIIYAAMERLAARGAMIEPGDLTDDELIRAEGHIISLLLQKPR